MARRRRKCIAWLKIACGEHSTKMLAEMAELGAYYNGQGWFRVTEDDIPVRELLESHGVEILDTGAPPPKLLNIKPKAVQLLGFNSWVKDM